MSARLLQKSSNYQVQGVKGGKRESQSISLSRIILSKANFFVKKTDRKGGENIAEKGVQGQMGIEKERWGGEGRHVGFKASRRRFPWGEQMSKGRTPV